jgi:hypothetical protein
MTISVLLLIFAFICFVLAAFNVNVTKVNWTGLGLAFWVLSILLGSHVIHIGG